MPRLTYVLRGLKSDEAKKDQSGRPRLPITPPLLTRIYHILLKDPHNFDSIMVWAASLLCFFGFLRSGEITIPSLHSYDPSVHLNYKDISVDDPSNPSIIKVHIKPTPSARELTYMLVRLVIYCVLFLLYYLTSPFADPRKVFCSDFRTIPH